LSRGLTAEQVAEKSGVVHVETAVDEHPLAIPVPDDLRLEEHRRRGRRAGRDDHRDVAEVAELRAAREHDRLAVDEVVARHDDIGQRSCQRGVAEAPMECLLESGHGVAGSFAEPSSAREQPRPPAREDRLSVGEVEVEQPLCRMTRMLPVGNRQAESDDPAR
jgi:hypothetical protein